MPQNIDYETTIEDRPRVQYVADGSRVEFPFTFRIIKKSDLDVYIGEQKLSSNYAVLGEGDAIGGVILLGEAPDAGEIVTLARNTPVRRISDFQQSGMFQAKILNDELDVLTAALQDVAESVQRSVGLSAVDGHADLDLPLQSDRANSLLGFDADGNIRVKAESDFVEDQAKPGGAAAQVQFNDDGKFGGAAGLTYTKTTGALSVDGGVRTDALSAKTAGAGVIVAGLVIKNGLIDGRDVSSDGAKLDTVEVGADVTDATNVRSSGAVMNSDPSSAAMRFVIDDDSMAAASDTTLATSKSIKAYVDSRSLPDGDMGDITVSGAVMTIGDNVVGNAKAADMAQDRIKGRISPGLGDPEDLTGAQVRAIAGVYSRAEVDALDWAAANIASGTFANERISQASVTQHQGAIDHDALTNYAAKEHIDWTSTTENLSTSGSAATGDLTVVGNIALSGKVDGRDIAEDGAKLDSLSAGGDGLGSANTVADMVGLTGARFPAGSRIFVDSYADAGDGGGGWFEARESGAAMDNGLVFAHDSAGTMRWHRLETDSESINVRWFGAQGDESVDDQPAIQAAIDAAADANRSVYFPAGQYRIGSTLTYRAPMFGVGGVPNSAFQGGTQLIGTMTDLSPIIGIPSGTYRWQLENLYLTGTGAKGIVCGGACPHYVLNNVMLRLLHTGAELQGWVGTITGSYALACLYKGWVFSSANGVSMRGGETQGCGETIAGSWAAAGGNRWTTSLSYAPYNLFFWKSDGTIQSVGAEKGSAGALAAEFDWHYDGITKTLTIYAPDDPAGRYTDVYIKAVGVHLKSGWNISLYNHPIENELGSTGLLVDEADDVGAITLDNVWFEFQHQPFQVGVDRGDRTVDYTVKGFRCVNFHVSAASEPLARRQCLLDNVHDVEISGSFDASVEIETTPLARNVRLPSSVAVNGTDTYGFNVLLHEDDTKTPSLGIGTALNLCPNPYFKGGARGFAKAVLSYTSIAEETTTVRVVGGSALRVAVAVAGYPRAVLHLPNQPWFAANMRGQRFGVSAWIWVPPAFDGTTFEPRIGARYRKAGATERNNTSHPVLLRAGAWVQHVAWVDVADVAGNDEFSVYITPTNGNGAATDGSMYCLVSDVVVTVGDQQIALGASGQWGPHPEFPGLQGPSMVSYGASAPADASVPALVGDRVYNTAPAAGGTLGWICTTAGSPGTWKAFGSVAA